MNITYDIEKLNQIAKDLYELLHLSVLFTDKDGKQLVKCYNPCDFCSVMQNENAKIRSGCRESDAKLIQECRESKKTCMHVCHMNLCDVAMPIIKNDILAAYVLLGRMRSTNCNSPNIENSPHLSALYYELPLFTDKELESLKSLLAMMLFSGAITIEESSTASEVKAYIESNIDKDLSLPALCKRFFISKNTLYKLFRNEYGCTVGEFISGCRINEAKRRLAESNDTVIAISDSLGFASYAYFCRFFKSITGFTPTEYRANIKRT